MSNKSSGAIKSIVIFAGISILLVAVGGGALYLLGQRSSQLASDGAQSSTGDNQAQDENTNDTDDNSSDQQTGDGTQPDQQAQTPNQGSTSPSTDQPTQTTPEQPSDEQVPATGPAEDAILVNSIVLAVITFAFASMLQSRRKAS